MGSKTIFGISERHKNGLQRTSGKENNGVKAKDRPRKRKIIEESLGSRYDLELKKKSCLNAKNRVEKQDQQDKAKNDKWGVKNRRII